MNSRSLKLMLLAAVSAFAFCGVVFVNSASGQDDGSTDETHTSMNNTQTQNSTIVRDSLLFTGPKTIPAGEFIHLYDATPYMIMNGHVAAHLPCDEDSETAFQILIGQAPELQPAELELVGEMSKPGSVCMYHADLHSAHGEHEGTANGVPITDIAIANPADARLRLLATSSVVIGVNEIAPLEEEHHGEEEEEGH